jgi:FAD-dependent urate hydroxylase
VAVIGGGLGGLVAAIALQQSGHRPVVYEQTHQFRPAGAGISLWPNGVMVLAALGLGDALAKLGGRMDRMGYSDSSGDPLTEFSLSPLYDTVGQRAWPLARADLQELLVNAVGPEHIRFGARCVGVRSSDGSATALFQHGTHVDADLVVAADGTHSTLRSWVAGQAIDRGYVGYVNFNSITTADELVAPPGLWRTWVGEGKRASVMPIGHERVYAVFDIPMSIDRAGPSGDGIATDELRDAFGGWGPSVRRLIEALDPDRVNRVLIQDLPPVEPWHRDRVVLLGDAVHAMAPDLGQGGCQALEDALVLSRCLNGGASVPDALAQYQAERLPRTADIVRRARQRAGLIHGEDPAATERWYASLRDDPGDEILAGLVQSVLTGPFRVGP